MIILCHDLSISLIISPLLNHKIMFDAPLEVWGNWGAVGEELYEKPFPFDRSKHAACFGDNDNHAANPDADHPLYRSKTEHPF